MKNFTLNKLVFLSGIAFLVSSCVSLNSISYNDDVYFDPNSNNETGAQVIKKKDKKDIVTDQEILDEYIANGSFYNDNYEDYDYRDRLNRFHDDNYYGDYYPRNRFSMSFGFGYPYGSSWGISYGFGYPYYGYGYPYYGYYDPFFYDPWYDPFFAWHNPYYSPWYRPHYGCYGYNYYGSGYHGYGYYISTNSGSYGINKPTRRSGISTGGSSRSNSGNSGRNVATRSEGRLPLEAKSTRESLTNAPAIKEKSSSTRPIANVPTTRTTQTQISAAPIAVDRY